MDVLYMNLLHNLTQLSDQDTHNDQLTRALVDFAINVRTMISSSGIYTPNHYYVTVMEEFVSGIIFYALLELVVVPGSSSSSSSRSSTHA